MAKKAKARKAKKKTAPKRRAKPARRARRKSRPVRKAVRRAAPARRRSKPGAKRPPKAAARVTRRPAPPTARAKAPMGGVPVSLARTRRQLADTERGSQADERMLAAARSGHDELAANLKRHTETSPALTAGDVDAKWEDAYAIGDEAPGGDNPTPDQDRVDEIGKALGVTYQEGQELEGGDEINERDHHRWEKE